MGTLNAAAMAEAVGEGLVGLRSALSYHLSANHYPPVPAVFVQVCMEAIEAGQDEDWDRLVELPEGIEWKDGCAAVEASALIESFHLDAFLATFEDETP